jgi:hypothetical protein
MLNRHNFQIAEMLPKDGDTLIERGIWIGPGATVETDGAHLITVTAPEAQPSLFPETDGIQPAEEFQPFVLDRESALRIAKALPKKCDDPSKFAAIDASSDDCAKATLAVNEVIREDILRARKLEGNYPDVQRAIPDTESARFEISLSAWRLAAILKQFEKFTAANMTPSVTLRLYDAQRGVRMDAESNGQRMTAVLMPLRQEDKA